MYRSPNTSFSKTIPKTATNAQITHAGTAPNGGAWAQTTLWLKTSSDPMLQLLRERSRGPAKPVLGLSRSPAQ
jgi:hypothetical protein